MQIYNLLVASITSAISLVVLVVTLLHYIYLDVKPELVRNIPILWVISILFALVAAAAWGCVRARARNHRLKWVFETSMSVVGGISIAVIVAALR